MRKQFTLTVAVASIVFAVGQLSAQAAPVAIGNPSFETVPAGGVGDWNTFAGGPGAVSAQATIMPRTGNGHMDLQIGGANAFAGVYQPTGLVINPGDIVTLSGYHKSLVDPFNATRELKLEWTGAPQLRVDTLVIPTDYTEFSLQGVAPAGTTSVTITYAISSFGAGQGESNVYLDDISLDVVRIPEPASMMLGAIGLVGLVGLVRRR